MIKRIKISNFFSINEEVDIDFIADDKCLSMKKDRVVETGDDKLNKICFFIGPNAGGKTNILKAFNLVRNIILGNIITSYADFEPFFLDKNSIKPLEIHVEFIISNYYYYKVILDISKRYPIIIHSEELKSNSKTIIKREKGKLSLLWDGFKEGKLLKEIKPSEYISSIAFLNQFFQIKELKNIEEYFNNSNISIKSYLNESKNEIINKITGVKQPTTPEKIEYILQYAAKNPKYFKILNNFISKIDVGIKEIVKKPVIEGLKEENQQILFNHKIGLKDSRQFPWYMESLGTQNFIIFLYELNKAIEHSSFAVIDEIEDSLHPELVKFLIDFIITSGKPVQLFATTHNIEVIEELYPDEVYLVEKKNGATVVYSAKDFEDIKCTDNLYVKYKNMKLGAYPKIEKPSKDDLNE